MNELHLPWLELGVLAPLLGAFGAALLSDSKAGRRAGLWAGAVALLATSAAWWDLAIVHVFEAHDRWDLMRYLFGRDLLVIDELSAPLLPLVALLYLLTQVTTSRMKLERFWVPGYLTSQTATMVALSSREPWLIVGMLVLGVVPIWLKLKRRGESPRVFMLYMSLMSLLLISGVGLISQFSNASFAHTAGLLLLTAGILLRAGVVPLHSWVIDLYEKAGFASALMYTTPLIGVYAALRLILPVTPTWLLTSIALLALLTALYAAGMTLVQRDARRFYCMLLLSNSALVLVGLVELNQPIGMTGALCAWLSVILALGGLGLTLRCVESRTGRISLAAYHGLFERTPMLAGFFLLTGLASIGFPGTIGFIAIELLVDGTIQVSPWLGVGLVITAAINGLAVLHAYFRIFTGKPHTETIDVRSRPRERLAILVLTLMIIGGGLWPQPGVNSRFHAAAHLIESRQDLASQSAAAPRQQPAVGH